MLLDEASVTGTANIVMAAVLAKGTTTIYNAACEPYVQQLCRLLNRMGAKISGIASNLLTIEGVEELHGTQHKMCIRDSYTGVDRVVKYDFTHRDVPEAFEGFRIAFISDLHYKSLLKEKGLNDLVRLLIAQKADVLLMGGDYQEGCEYVEPLFSALARVKTPMGTYGVMGNNDYERCHDDIVNTMKHYGMRPLEHEVEMCIRDSPALR